MESTETSARLFTAEEANAMLPLIRAIVGDLVSLAGEVAERRQRLDHLSVGRNSDDKDPYAEELAQIESELEKDSQRLREYVKELDDLGVVLQGVMEGIVDFPALVDGRLAYLCWKYDEPEIVHWHELDAGFAGRQRLTADAADSPGSF
jgi:hypothetical protein